MKMLLPVVALMGLATSAFASTITLDCTPAAITNSITLGVSVGFMGGHGTGSFGCSDASLGAVTLNNVSINVFTDYETGNGTNATPINNSAGFTFTDGAATWANMMAGASTTTMSLTAPGVTLFVIGNASSTQDTFTNTTSGGLAGTPYVEPATDAQTGALVGVFTLPVTAFIDAGGFSNGLSSAHVSVTYDYTDIMSAAPEPISMALVGSALLGLAFIGRRRSARK